MTISIIIPWQDRGEGSRSPVFEYVRKYYESLDIGEVVIGTYPATGELLNRSRLRNEGAKAAKGDILFFVDADTLVPKDQILEACDRARQPGAVLPHDLFRTNVGDATIDQIIEQDEWEQYIDHKRPHYLSAGPLSDDWHVGPTFVVSRETWDAVGGFDEGFVGWGEEEKDFLVRVKDEVAPMRFVPGGILHLGMPPEEEYFPPEFKANRQRYLRKRRPVRIAVYAPAKNEESNVRAWYETVKNADEIVLVDTGSTDRTVAVAQEIGHIKVRSAVISPWRFDDGFNAALSQVSADIDIAIPLHLDERLVDGWRDELQKAWIDGGNRFTFQYRWSGGISFTHDRIHARHGYRWKYPAHEMPIGDGPQIDTGVVIQHFPSDEDRGVRDRSLIYLMAEEHPNDPRAQYYAGREKCYAGEWVDARRLLTAYLENPKATFDQERSEACRHIARMVWPQEKEKWLLRACSEAPQRREVWADLAEHYCETDRMDLAAGIASRVLSIVHPTRNNSFLLEDSAWNDERFHAMITSGR